MAKTATDRLVTIREQMAAIYETAGDTALTDEQRKSYDLLRADAETELAAIDAAEKADAQRADDLAVLKSINMLPKLRTVEAEAFDQNTTGRNEMSLGNLGKADDTAPMPQTLGAMFVKSKSYAAALDAGGGAAIAKGAHIGVDTGVLVKTLLTSPTVGTTVTLSDHTVRRFRLMDAITVLPTGSDTLLSHRYTLTNNAAVVAEGAAKPESALAVTTATLTPTKIAHHIPVTAEALADHPRMRALVDSIMVKGVLAKVEAQVATDLAAWSGLATQAFASSVVETILRAKEAAEDYSPATGVLMNSADYVALALTAGTSNDHYIAPGPFGASVFTVWGLPVIPTGAIAAGFAYVGAVDMVTWNERTPITLATGWVNTQFTENEVTILAEQRGMTDVQHNLAIVKADLTV